MKAYSGFSMSGEEYDVRYGYRDGVLVIVQKAPAGRRWAVHYPRSTNWMGDSEGLSEIYIGGYDGLGQTVWRYDKGTSWSGRQRNEVFDGKNHWEDTWDRDEDSLEQIFAYGKNRYIHFDAFYSSWSGYLRYAGQGYYIAAGWHEPPMQPPIAPGPEIDWGPYTIELT